MSFQRSLVMNCDVEALRPVIAPVSFNNCGSMTILRYPTRLLRLSLSKLKLKVFNFVQNMLTLNLKDCINKMRLPAEYTTIKTLKIVWLKTKKLTNTRFNRNAESFSKDKGSEWVHWPVALFLANSWCNAEVKLILPRYQTPLEAFFAGKLRQIWSNYQQTLPFKSTRPRYDVTTKFYQ